MKTVLNIESKDYSNEAIKIWTSTGFNYQESTWNSQDDLPVEIIENTHVLIVRLERFVGMNELQKFKNLQYLVSATTGHDHIDLNYLIENKIQLISLREHADFLKTIPSTAELAWGLIINLLRFIPQSYNHVLEGNWQRECFKGFQLKEKTLGIVGLGRIGSIMAKYAQAFNMKVQFFDPNITNSEFHKCASLQSLMNSSDIVSLHLHLTKETEYLISENVISQTKNPFFLVNTSRGKIVDETAILKGLQSGQILGYATDVLDNELDGISNNPLIIGAKQNLPILITPHIGGASFDAMWACEKYLAKIVCQNN
jgi:D-3-phosphoglycerate dehydrogenase / 2-oxoglutarate reductase